MTLPPEKRVDDLEGITPETRLWRHIDPESIKADPKNPGRLRFPPEQFRTFELSVLSSTAIDLDGARKRDPGMAIAELTAAEVRSLDLIIASDPADAAHKLIYRKDQPGVVRITKGQARTMAENARHV